MIDVQDWAEMRRMRGEGASISEIARVLGVARNTVRSAVRSDGPPKYERTDVGSIVDPFVPQIREFESTRVW